MKGKTERERERERERKLHRVKEIHMKEYKSMMDARPLCSSSLKARGQNEGL